MMKLFSRIFPGRADTPPEEIPGMHPARLGRFGRATPFGKLSGKPQAKRAPIADAQWTFSEAGLGDREFRVRLYRFLRDHIPLLKAVVWTWTRLAVAPHHFEFTDGPAALHQRARRVLENLDRRIYPHPTVRFGGFDTLLIQFFNSLFTDGGTAGELIVNPAHNAVDKFYLIDAATIDFDPTPEGDWRIVQRFEGKKIPLTTASVYYYPLDADANSPHGKSLLSAVGFVARVEQELIADMRRAMHNAGYHRLHVKIHPPEKQASETEQDYTERANTYFDRTVAMMRDFEVDDNPVTWDDVEISHVGPSSQVSSSTNWYVNHKAMVEDVIAGCHLAPFMLGYSYGATQNWAQFKYEMVQRQVFSLQKVASNFLEWIANIELALHGIEVDCRHVFDNRLNFGLVDKLQAEKLRTELLIAQMDKGLITPEEAREKLLLSDGII
jgi:hypothetical protein